MWGAIASIGGSLLSGLFNSDAADEAAQAQLQAAKIQARMIQQGQKRAAKTLHKIRKAAAPSIPYLQNAVTESGQLTPAQQQQLEDLRRNVSNTIHSSPFAGSGRTAAALFRRAESDFTNEALDRNKARADTAAGRLWGGYTGAAGQIASGQQTAGAQMGAALGQGTANAGMIQAQGTLANGKLFGQAIGDIGSMIAGMGRSSRYGSTYGNPSKLGTLY